MPSGAAVVVPLVVQLLSPLPAEEERALIESCSLAHRHGPCVRERDARAQDTLRAVVEFSSETQVVVEVTDTDPQRNLYASRELRFRPEDAPGERSRAIGLALGVLSTSLTKNRAGLSETEDGEEQDDEDRSTEEGRAAPGRPNQGRGGPMTARSPLLWLSGAGGAEATPAWPGVGPVGELSAAIFPGRYLGGGVSGSLSWLPPSDQRPSLISMSVGGDGLLRFSWETSRLWIQPGIGATWLQARLAASDAPRPAGARLAPHVRLRATWGRSIGKHSYVTVSPQVQVLLSPTTIFIDEQRSTGTGAVKLLGTIGLAWTD